MPFIPGLRIVSGDIKKTVTTWPDRLAEQLHAGFLRCPAGFTPIAGHTSADDVFPDMLPIPVSRHDMVQSKLAGFFTAILASIVVSPENLESGQLSLSQIGAPDHGSEANY